MLTDFADLVMWILRLGVAGGIAWGAWLCLTHTFLPARSLKRIQFEQFATFALLILLLTTLGSLGHPVA
ncbi:MAG TPA: hypothetical protein VFO09_08745 [Methyloceanibacter sp.]|nr:hypothetical protein [Methyloceanibacter sp.]